MDERSSSGVGGLRVPGGIRTREALEARKPTSTPTEPPLVVPTLKGPLLERLRRAEPRPPAGEWISGAVQSAPRLGRAEEVGAAALGLLLLDGFRRAGGAKPSARAAQEALEHLLGALEPQARVAVEVEAYEVLQWLSRALDLPEESPQDARPSDKLALIQRAIEQERDLELRYLVAGSKPELAWRRVTPWRLDAQKYLHAFCHLRQDERVFRLSRVDQARLAPERRTTPEPPRSGAEPSLEPVRREPGGAPRVEPSRRATLGMTLDEAVRADAQMSLLDNPAPLEDD
jgi:predicted DNA-binding transcriptional regulator YafY